MKDLRKIEIPDKLYPHIVVVDREYFWCKQCNCTCDISADAYYNWRKLHSDICSKTIKRKVEK